MAQYWRNFDQFTAPDTATSTWAALELFAGGAAKAGPNPSRQAIMNGIYSLGPGFTLGGLIPPETLTRASRQSLLVSRRRIKDEQYVMPFGSQVFCQPAA
jgi:hypothetical protein